MKRLLIYIALIQCFYSYGQSYSDFTCKEIKDDIEFVYNAIKQIHPNSNGLSLNSKTRLLASISNDYYSESDAFFVLNGLLKQLNDGHSNIKFSASRGKEIIKYGVFFPYELEFFDSSAVVIGHINGLHSDAIGKEIVKINQIPIKHILRELSVVVMKDGENNQSLEDWLEEDFWFYFTLYNGFRNSYSVSYLQNGHEVHEIAKAQPRLSYIKSELLASGKISPLSFYYLEGIPVLKIHSFDKRDKPWWKREIKAVMKRLNANSDSSLILDLRGNGGGEEQLQNILLESFGVDEFNKYEQEYFKDVKLAEVKGLNKRLVENFRTFGLKKFVFRNKESENLRSKKCKQQPELTESDFQGDLYILVDGATFSCGSDAAAILKENFPKTTVLGTETRGSGKENYAGYFLHLTLPNTGFELRIPRVKYVLKTKAFAKDSGVIPDLKVEKSKLDLINGIDTQLEYTVSLAIMKGRLQETKP